MKTFEQYFAAIYAFLIWMWEELKKKVADALSEAKTFATNAANTAFDNAKVFTTESMEAAKAFATQEMNRVKSYAVGVADIAMVKAQEFASKIVAENSAADRQYALELVNSEMSRIEALAKVTAFLTIRHGDYKDGVNLLDKTVIETLLNRALVAKDVVRIVFEYPLGMVQPFKLGDADLLVDNGDELILVVENGLPKMQSRFDNTTSTTVYNNTQAIAGNTKLLGKTVKEVQATKQDIDNHEGRILNLEGFKKALDGFSADLEAFKAAQMIKVLQFVVGAGSDVVIEDFVGVATVLYVSIDGAQAFQIAEQDSGNKEGFAYRFGAGVLEFVNKGAIEVTLTISNADSSSGK